MWVWIKGGGIRGGGVVLFWEGERIGWGDGGKRDLFGVV